MVTHTSTWIGSLRKALRDNLFLPSLISKVLPYESGIRLQRNLLQRPLIQQIFYGRQIKLITRVANLCDGKNTNHTQSIVLSLMGNTWRGWRKAALLREPVNSWASVIGLENLIKADVREGGAILITTHAFRSNLLTTLIKNQGSSNIFFIHQVYETQDRSYLMSAYARQLAEAIKILKKGGILCIAGDGQMGEGGITVPFYGRLMEFRSGYADLALRTGATLLPIFQYMEPDGRIVYEITPKLVPSTGNRKDQIESIVRQYIHTLRERWPRIYPSIAWFKLEQYLNRPAVE